MTRWGWQGLFELDVPVGWRIDESEDLIQFVPPSQIGAAQVSVLRRTRRGPVGIGEAQELTKNFAARQGVQLVAGPEAEANGARTCLARFLAGDRPLQWEVESLVWPDRAFVCTYCGEPGPDPSRDAALAMFQTIVRPR